MGAEKKRDPNITRCGWSGGDHLANIQTHERIRSFTATIRRKESKKARLPALRSEYQFSEEIRTPNNNLLSQR